MLFVVTPSLPCASNVTVNYQSSGGTAGVGSDYTAANDTLLIPAMQAQGTIAVTVHGDTEFEWPDEIFYVDLSAPVNAGLGDSQAIGTIGEDDVEFKDSLYKMRITFSGYDGSETLRNFPALVTFDPGISRFAYEQFASPHGHDLRFTDGNQMRPLSYEIDHWDTNGTSYVWVRVPELSGTDTTVWAYWGATGDVLAVSAATDVPDCALWLRADADVETNGTSVTGWLDQSGQNNHAAQTVAAARPILVESVLNGKPVLRFDGAGDYLQVADHSSLDNTAGLTIFTVVTPSNLDNTRPRAILSKRVSSSSNQSYAQFFYHTGNKLHNDIQDGSGDRFLSATTFVNGNTYITELVYDGSLPAAQRSKLGVNGTHDVTASESASSISDYTGNLTIGILNAGYGDSLGCDIAEIIIYRRALSTNETLSVGRYLEQKYDLKSGYGTDAPIFASDGSTWSQGYAGVWHLREGGESTRFDSTANDNDTSSLEGDPNAAAGRIGGGNDFDGSEGITVPDSDSLGDDTVDSVSVSAWMKSDVFLTTTADAYRVLEKGDGYFLVQGSGSLGSGGMNFIIKSGGTVRPAAIGTALDTNRWYHVTGTYDGTDMRVYLDGALKDTYRLGTSVDDDGLPFKIGSDDNWPNRKYFNGVLDEVRVSSVWRSPDWVWATYENMADTGAFQARGGVVVTHGATLFIVR